MDRRFGNLLLGLVLFLPALACGSAGGVTPTPMANMTTPALDEQEVSTGQQESVELLEATFAQGLSEEMQPIGPRAQFAPDETVYLSIRIKGSPGKGTVTARFLWGEETIADASIDLADVNGGTVFSVGQDTFAGYTLTHDETFPISDDYGAQVYYDEQYLGTFPFKVSPPHDAIPSRIDSATTALGADDEYNPIEPTTDFAPGETVYLVGHGDLGTQTWLQADWYVNGRLDDYGTRSLTLEENATDMGFSFSYLPEGGWPPGEHLVVLTMDDKEVGRYSFTVQPSGGAALPDEASVWDAFPLPDDAELVPVIQPYDYGFATSMIEPEIFDAYAEWLTDVDWQQQAPTEAVKTLPHQVWRRDGEEFVIEVQGLDQEERTVVWVTFEPAR